MIFAQNWFSSPIRRGEVKHDWLPVGSQLTIMTLSDVESELPHNNIKVVFRKQTNTSKNATCYT